MGVNRPGFDDCSDVAACVECGVVPVVAVGLVAASIKIRGVALRCPVDRREPAKRHNDVEAVTFAEHTGHGDGGGELFEVLGGRVVGHPVDGDVVV